ncbi:MAG TPA: 30S ribosome-binding factor RbfA [Verrucomicrobiae bacterium]|nr:30S ribosome-binding factor RbfA [Verrucomicrobiae bacterium]
MTTRTERLADLIRDEVARLLLREVKDPRIGFVTLTGARVTPDLRQARLFVSVLGDEKARDAALEGLRRSAPFIQRALFRNLRLRHSPTLIFEIDDSLERGDRIEHIIQQLHEQETPGSDPEPDKGTGPGPSDGPAGEQEEKG